MAKGEFEETALDRLEAKWAALLESFKAIADKAHARTHAHKPRPKKIRTKAYNVSSNSLIIEYKKLRQRGFFDDDPERELYYVEQIIEHGGMNRGEGRWAGERRTKLLERINNPSPRYRVVGARVGGLTTKELEWMQFLKCVDSIKRELDEADPWSVESGERSDEIDR